MKVRKLKFTKNETGTMDLVASGLYKADALEFLRYEVRGLRRVNEPGGTAELIWQADLVVVGEGGEVFTNATLAMGEPGGKPEEMMEKCQKDFDEMIAKSVVPEPRILYLNVDKKIFDGIASGEIKEGSMKWTHYWWDRIGNGFDWHSRHMFRRYDQVLVCNGFKKGGRKVRVECKGIKLKKGRPEWGADPSGKCFVVELGEVIA